MSVVYMQYQWYYFSDMSGIDNEILPDDTEDLIENEGLIDNEVEEVTHGVEEVQGNFKYNLIQSLNVT